MCSMEGIMKELGKCRAVIALLCFTATVFSGCGNRTEAVITDGEDITTVSAESVSYTHLTLPTNSLV